MGIASRIAAVTENLGGDYPTGGIQYNLNALEEAAQGGGGGLQVEGNLMTVALVKNSDVSTSVSAEVSLCTNTAADVKIASYSSSSDIKVSTGVVIDYKETDYTFTSVNKATVLGIKHGTTSQTKYFDIPNTYYIKRNDKQGYTHVLFLVPTMRELQSFVEDGYDLQTQLLVRVTTN